MCGEIALALRRAWGRGPTSTTAHWAGARLLVVLMEDGLTVQELALRAAGHSREVLDGRRLLNEIIEGELRDIVEHATQRTVISVLAATALDPDLSAAIFVFGDSPEPPEPASVADTQAEARQQSREEARALRAEAEQVRRTPAGSTLTPPPTLSARRRAAPRRARRRTRCTSSQASP